MLYAAYTATADYVVEFSKETRRSLFGVKKQVVKQSVFFSILLIAVFLVFGIFPSLVYGGISGNGSIGDPYDIGTGDLEIDADEGGEYYITGSTTNNRIRIKGKDEDDVKEIKLHLVNVSMNLQKGSDHGDSREEACISLEGHSLVTIYVDANTATTLVGGNDHGATERDNGRPAIHVHEDAVLNLEVLGILNATGGDGGSDRGAAAIGSEDNEGCCGTLNIHVSDGGHLKAVAKYGGAGIGGGNNSGTKDISIVLDGNAKLEAYGKEGAAGIGGGDDGSCKNISIKGNGVQTSVIASGESGGAGIGGGSDGKVSSITIDGVGTVKSTGGHKAAGIGAGDHDGVGDGGNIGSVTVKNCETVEATGGEGGAGIGGSEDSDIDSVTVENCTEVIATGGKDAAGIGTGRDSSGGVDVNCGPVTVKNSMVTATCPDGDGAGIGCGRFSHVSKILISVEKNITATGHGEGCGIGYAGGSVGGIGGMSADQIEIQNVKALLTATAGSNAAGIGPGDVSLSDNRDIGSIKIYMNGGTLNVTGHGSNNAGIGGGRSHDGIEANISKILIQGPGTVTAKGTENGAAIGSGDDLNVEDGIYIAGTDGKRDLTLNVSNVNKSDSPLIGIDDPANDKDKATEITIKNAVINGTTVSDGRKWSVCIGAGQNTGNNGNTGRINKITIDNCKIKLDGDGGVGIGGNCRVSVGEIDISNTDYDGFSIGSMGFPFATIFNGDITSYMDRINITNSNVKAIAKAKRVNESYVFPMAGIGGGNKTWVGEINISDSTVTAKGLLGGAGIGGGGYLYDSSFIGDFFTVYGDMGDYFGDKINISNSTVNATGAEGQIYEYMRPGFVINGEGEVESLDYKTRQFCGCGAGIGGGGFQSFKEINISNSNVTALAAGTTNYGTMHRDEVAVDSGAAGIGGGSMGTSDKIVIDQSIVSSTGTFGGAGIGSGGKDYEIQQSLLKAFTGDIGKGDVPQITIENGSDVTACGGFYGAGIGAGERGSLKNIAINASKVKATGGEGGAGIGGGTNTDVSKAAVTIFGGSSVAACGGMGGAGIGSGVNFDKNNPGGTDLFQRIVMKEGAKVKATGGAGAAGIGGGSGDSNYLSAALLWDSGKEKRGGIVNDLSISEGAFVVSKAGNNCISDDAEIAYHDTAYKTAPVDIGEGGSFVSGGQTAAEKFEINGATVLNGADTERFSAWKNSFRYGGSANGFAKNTGGKHLDKADGPAEVFKVRLQVPHVTECCAVRITVDGDGSKDNQGQPYYNGNRLYTDADGMLWLWLQSGRKDATTATVSINGIDYYYQGTSKTDHTGVLRLISKIEVVDYKKAYDGQPPREEDLLGRVSGGGEVTLSYYQGDQTAKQPEELAQMETIPLSEVAGVGTYTVFAQLSASEYSGAAWDVGLIEIMQADTFFASLSASREEKEEGKKIVTLQAVVAGLVSGEEGCGTVSFVAKQGDEVAHEETVSVNGDGIASVSFEADAAAGDYQITAEFVCDPDRPNYEDSSADPVTYSLDKIDVALSMDAVKGTYGDAAIPLPALSLDLSEPEGERKSEDEAAVRSGVSYSLGEQDVVAFNPDQTLKALSAGHARLKASFEGNERLNSASLTVPVLIEKADFAPVLAAESKTYDGQPASVTAQAVPEDYQGEYTFYYYKKAGNEYVPVGDSTETEIFDAGSYRVLAEFTEDSNYHAQTAGAEFEIGQRALRVETGSAVKVYDGTPLTAEDAELTGLSEGETAVIKATGAQTACGIGRNTYRILWAEDDPELTASESNYVVAEEALGTLEVIDPAKLYTFTVGNNSKWTKGSGNDLTFKVERSFQNEKAIEHFTGITIDGKTVGKKHYTAKSGSVILTLKAGYLETLGEGNHALKALFDDGEGSCAFRIAKENEKNPDPDNGGEERGEGAKTGDASGLSLWVLLMAACCIPAAFLFAAIRKKER